MSERTIVYVFAIGPSEPLMCYRPDCPPQDLSLEDRSKALDRARGPSGGYSTGSQELLKGGAYAKAVEV